MSLHALEFAERRARYVFLAELIQGAAVAEILDPAALLEPGAAFLTSLGAASARSILARPDTDLPLPGLDAFGARASPKAAEPSLLILDDGLSWLSEIDRFDALLGDLGAAEAKARIALVLRNPAGTALASLDGKAVREKTARFDFPSVECALKDRFQSVSFATQSAVWGSQLAPLTDDAQALDCAIDGRLGEHCPAAFFIALCAQAPLIDDLPREWTIVPLDLRPLARCALRFERLSDDLQRAQAERARVESLMGHQREDRRQRDELEQRLAEALRARGEFETRCQVAEARSVRTEHLLDELAAERTALIAQLDTASKKITALQEACAEAERSRHEAEAARVQAEREREAHLRLSKAALDRLQNRIQELEAARARAADGRAADSRHERMAMEIEAQSARIQKLDELILEQDARLEECGALEQKLQLARAERIQGEARVAEVDAKLIERSLWLDALAEEIQAMDQALDMLARKRNGKAIESLLELHERLRADRPRIDLDDVGAGGVREEAAFDEGEDEDDDEEAMI